MVYTKTYIFTHFYQQYLVLFTMAPRNSRVPEVPTIRLIGFTYLQQELLNNAGRIFSLLGGPPSAGEG